MAPTLRSGAQEVLFTGEAGGSDAAQTVRRPLEGANAATGAYTDERGDCWCLATCGLEGDKEATQEVLSDGLQPTVDELALGGCEGAVQPGLDSREDDRGVSVQRGSIVVRESWRAGGMQDDEENIRFPGCRAILVYGTEKWMEKRGTSSGGEGDSLTGTVRKYRGV